MQHPRNTRPQLRGREYFLNDRCRVDDEPDVLVAKLSCTRESANLAQRLTERLYDDILLA
jgi:hypothetical protein